MTGLPEEAELFLVNGKRKKEKFRGVKGQSAWGRLNWKSDGGAGETGSGPGWRSVIRWANFWPISTWCTGENIIPDARPWGSRKGLAEA